MDVSKNIRAIRESKSLTQVDVAQKLGTERSNYARLENRGENLTIKQISEIADALEVSIYDIIGLPESTDLPIDESEKVNLLEEKLETLQEILKDKRKNIKLYKSFIEWTKEKFRVNFHVSALTVAEDLGFLKIDREKDIDIYPYGLNDEQLYQVGLRMLDTSECAAFFLNDFLASSGFIDDQWFIKAYKDISRKRKEKVAPAESINWVNGVFEFLEDE